jgi:hypothetical protein
MSDIDFWGNKGNIKGKPKKKAKGIFLASKKFKEPKIGLYSPKVYWTHTGGDKVDLRKTLSNRVSNYLNPGRAKKEQKQKGYQEIGERLTAQRELKRGLVKSAPRGLSQRAKAHWAELQYENLKGKTQPIVVKGDGASKSQLTPEQRKILAKERGQRKFKKRLSAFIPIGGMKAAIRIRPDKSSGIKQESMRAESYFSQNPYNPNRAKNLGGRPTGTYTHSIPGKGPVGVYEWRRWMSQQKALNRARAAQLGDETMQQEAVQQNQQMQMQQQQQFQDPQYEGQQYQQQSFDDPNQAQAPSQLPPENKFTKQLQFEQAMYNREEYNRLINEQPKGFVQQSVRQRQILTQQAREFSRRNSLLNAHKAMLTPQENAIDFLDNNPTEPTILDTRNNNIMVPVPTQIDIMNTGRPNILQAQGLPDVSNQNIMNAQRLNFGKINLTGEETM